MIRLLSLAMLLAFSTNVFAAAGVGGEPVHGNYNNPNDAAGLCVADNEKYHYYKSGHCLTILESLRSDGCIKDKIEEIRLRYLGDEAKMKAAKLKETSSVNLFSCSHKTDDGDQNLKSIAKDPDHFAMIMMQLFALIAVQESNWRVLHNGNNSQSQTVKCERNCGLLGLDKSEMEKTKYSCGCQIPDKEDNQKQYDPTMDGHLNLKCGITMALFEAKDDKGEISILGGGKPKGPNQPEDGRYGFAKVFKSLQTPDVDNEGDDTPKEKIMAKMKLYCESHAFAGKNVNEWKRQLQDSKDANSLK